jgi:hypothetical protein
MLNRKGTKDVPTALIGGGTGLVHLPSIGELQPRNRQRSTLTIVGHDLA